MISEHDLISEHDRQVLSQLPAWNPTGDIVAQRRAWEELATVYNHDLPAIGGLEQNVELRSGLRADVAVASPTRIWCARARVAVVMHAYVCAGWTREDAAKKVAGVFPEINSLAAFERQSSSSPPWKKALNWYDQFKKPNSKINPEARTLFDLGSKTAPLGAPATEVQQDPEQNSSETTP